MFRDKATWSARWVLRLRTYSPIVGCNIGILAIPFRFSTLESPHPFLVRPSTCSCRNRHTTLHRDHSFAAVQLLAWFFILFNPHSVHLFRDSW